MRSRDLDPYEVLGLEDGATWEEVRTAYRRLAKKHHPDKNPGDKVSEWIFKQVGEAYERLKPLKRTRSGLQEDHKHRGPQGPGQQDASRNDAERDRRAREQRDKERARTSRDQQDSQHSPRTSHSGIGGNGRAAGRRHREWLLAIPAGLVVAATVLAATEGFRDGTNNAEPAVVDDRGPSATPRQSTQHDEPLGTTRIRRFMEARYGARAREQATDTTPSPWAAEPVSGEFDQTPAGGVYGRAYGEELASQPATEELHFEMPPPGTDLILSLPQLRWCLREDRMIESYRPNVLSEWDHDAFNRILDRYNDRCGSFRYRQGDLERARREVGGRVARQRRDEARKLLARDIDPSAT